MRDAKSSPEDISGFLGEGTLITGEIRFPDILRVDGKVTGKLFSEKELVVGETVLPAAVGLTMLGDHARPGWGLVAAAGFVLAVGAALLLSRFGEVSIPPADT